MMSNNKQIFKKKKNILDVTLNNRNNVCFFQMQCLLSFNLLKYGLQDTLHKVKYSSSKVKKLSRGQENLLLKKNLPYLEKKN